MPLPDKSQRIDFARINAPALGNLAARINAEHEAVIAGFNEWRLVLLGRGAP